MSEPIPITRFAPSPTGYLHIGGARTALYNWLLARHAGGKFLLRVEDTDLARNSEESARALLEDLRWLGLHWDNAQVVYQSKRVDKYNAIFEDLLQRGRAYKAYETAEELEAQRLAAQKEKRVYTYQRPQLTAEQERQYVSENRPSVVRFAMPRQEYRFHDVVLDKEVVLAAAQVQDFVIRKTDGMPTYHFAVVIDDAEMGITHILRGQEHLLNTINHVALQEALGYERPIYGHLPVILNPDGSKMSKRDRDKKIRERAQIWMKTGKRTADDLATAASLEPARIAQWLGAQGRQLEGAEQKAVIAAVGMTFTDVPEIDVHDFRVNGYFPEVVLNFLALMGWNPGSDRERMSVPEMTQAFLISDIGKSNARFNREKLLAFNTEFAASAPLPRLIAALRDFLAAWPESPIGKATDAQLETILRMNKGMQTLRQVESKSRFLFMADDAIVYDPAAVDKVLRKNDGFATVNAVAGVLLNVPAWTHDALESAVTGFCTEKGLVLGKVAQPLRVAISGSTISPPIFDCLQFLGKDRSSARIARCLALAAG